MEIIHKYNTTYSTETIYSEESNWKLIQTDLFNNYTKVIWIIDEKLAQRNEFNGLKNVLFISSGESCKSFSQLDVLLKTLTEYEVDRNSCIVSIGGGSISDLVGFVSSIYLRGISFISIPTTILGLIDASMGGKNGINFSAYKNQVGTIYQPKQIIFYPPFFDSLGKVEIADGFAEIIKYAITLDKDLFAILEQSSIDEFIQNNAIKREIIHRCIIQKSLVIEQDPFEKDIRKVLNFGHTIGHALESLYGYSHGQAVGLGMLFAVKMSEKRIGASMSIYNKLTPLLEKYHLPVKTKEFDPESLYKKILHDKKRKDQTIDFVLVESIGQYHISTIALNELLGDLIQAKNERWI